MPNWSDRAAVLVAVHEDGRGLQAASTACRQDREVVFAAVHQLVVLSGPRAMQASRPQRGFVLRLLWTLLRCLDIPDMPF